jgi:hypothetical protein
MTGTPSKASYSSPWMRPMLRDEAIAVPLRISTSMPASHISIDRNKLLTILDLALEIADGNAQSDGSDRSI